MEPDRWQRLSELMSQALDLPAAQRPAFVASQCPDPADRQELAALLARVQDTLAPPPALAAVAEDLVQSLDSSRWIGQRLGSWRLTGLLGEGGMGVVFAAEHIELPKVAAVKLLRQTLVDPLAQLRFRQEQEILARLDHPNIARLMDGGTEQGVPYLVMERVEGEPLLAWCESRRLGVQARLALFLQLCEALRYAHRNLVVHRDLKPSNVLVTAEGVPKLLDFGIARLLDGRQQAALTGTADHLMTPGYASPEQVRGEPVSTATDVYALGVLLYELLTGQQAQAVRTLEELVEVVCERTPPLASAAAQDKDLARQLRGDLDTILAMALRKEPERRYPSAAELADDIQRHLNLQPVLARPDTLGYRWGRFVRRNWLPLGLVALLLLSLVVGLFSTLRLAQSRAVEAERAERRFAEVRKLATTFLFEFDEAIRPVAGNTEARELVVRTAQTYLEGLAAEAGDDPTLLDELATAYARLGTVQGLATSSSLGRTSDAKVSLEKALALREQLLRLSPEDRANRRSMVDLLADMAVVYETLGENEANEAVTARALALARDLRPGGSPEDLDACADAAVAQAELYRGVDRYTEAADIYTEAQTCLKEALALAYDAEREQSLAFAMERQASLLGNMGELDRALAVLLESRALREKQLQADPENALAQRRVLTVSQLLSLIYWNPGKAAVGDREAGQAHAQRMLEIAETLHAKDPANATAVGDLARALYTNAAILSEHDPERALALYDRAIGLTGSMAEGLDQVYGRTFLLRLSAVPLRALGRLEEALQRLDRSDAGLAELRAAGQDGGYLEAVITLERGRVYRQAGRWAEAELAFQRAASVAQAQVDENPVWLDMAQVLSDALGEQAGALEQLGQDPCEPRRRALALWQGWAAKNQSAAVKQYLKRAEEAAAACGA